MYQLLRDMRVIEGSSFVASPVCGLYLAQMGAEVIRFDAIGGGPDYHRWPRVADGGSFYWEGLNKGKKSIAIDLSTPEGRELAIQLVTAPGERGGLFVTNYPPQGFLAHEKLVSRRPDLITVRIMGRPDGGTAVDHTVNCAVGLPLMTGPLSLGDCPVNHALPAWDLLAGAYGAFTLLAAERQRRITGEGTEARIPLSDIAITSIAHLGQIAEVLTTHSDRPRFGNDVYGAFGRDYRTRDGKQIMLVALTPKHWKGLISALGIHENVAAVERRLGVSFAIDAGVRFQHREELTPLVEKAVGRRDFEELREVLIQHQVCWGPYQTVLEAALHSEGLVRGNPVFSTIENPSGFAYPVPGSAATLPGHTRGTPKRAAVLGEHTDQILAETLQLSDAEIGRLHDRGIVATRLPQ